MTSKKHLRFAQVFWYSLAILLLAFYFYYTYKSIDYIIFRYDSSLVVWKRGLGIAVNILFLIIEFIATINGIYLFYVLGSSIGYKSPKNLKNKFLTQDILPAVAVIIASYKEPFELLSKTIKGAMAIDYPKDRYQIYVCDDSPAEMSIELDAYCRKMNIPVIRRKNREGFKAGALNNALFSVESDFMAILDADHVPRKNFLKSCLSGFVDDKTMAVQCKTIYTNQETWVRKSEAFMYTLYFQMLQKSRDGRKFSFFGGSGGMFNSKLLKEIKGFSMETICEDTDTTFKALLNGYNQRYVDDVVTEGLIPPTPLAIVKQMQRWNHGLAHICNKRTFSILKYRGKIFNKIDMLVSVYTPVILISLWFMNIGNLLIYYFGWSHQIQIVRPLLFESLPMLGPIMNLPLLLISNVGLIVGITAWIRDQRDPEPTILKSGFWPFISYVYGFYIFQFVIVTFLITSVLKGLLNIPMKFNISIKLVKNTKAKQKKRFKMPIMIFLMFVLSTLYYVPIFRMVMDLNPLGGWFVFFTFILTVPIFIGIHESLKKSKFGVRHHHGKLSKVKRRVRPQSKQPIKGVSSNRFLL